MHFLQKYDPANFGLFFALKATIAFIGSVSVGFLVGGLMGAIFAANAALCIFFLESLDGDMKTKSSAIALFALLGAWAIWIMAEIYQFGLWLVLPTFAWVFVAQISSLYNANLGKVLQMTTMNGIVTLVVLGSSTLQLKEAVLGSLVGTAVAGFLRLCRFGKYGKFTAKINSILLDDLTAMCREFDHTKEFQLASQKCSNDIEKFKEIFEHKSANIKNSSSIIFHSKAIFYLYKLEDIFHALLSLKSYQHNMPQTEIVAAAFEEIAQNLQELKKIFKGEKPNLVFAVFEEIKQSQHKVFASSLAIAYDKFNLIKKGGDDEIVLQRKKSRTLAQTLRLISLKNESTLNAFRVALSVSIAIFIAFETGVDHGVWIAIGVVTVSKNSSYMTRQTGLSQMGGNCVGLFIGLGLVFAFKGVLPLFLLLLLTVIFIAFYLRLFPIFYFYIAFMTAFVMCFYLIQPDFLTLVLLRFIDICIGFVIAFAISFAFKNRSNKLLLNAKFHEVLKALHNLLSLSGFAKKESLAVRALNNYKTAITQSDGRSFGELKTSLLLYKNLEELNSLISNLRDYTKVNGAQLRHDAALENDIKIIAVRFEMIDKKLCALPYYFYDNLDERWLCKDSRAHFLLRQIASLQEKIIRLV